MRETKLDAKRAEQARAMGFDIDHLWFTGTPNGDIDAFDPSRTADENLAYGQGIYTTADPDAASGYTRPGASWGNDTDEDATPTVYPVFLRVANPFDLAKIYPFAEMKRIFEHCYPDSYEEFATWKEALDELGMVTSDDEDEDATDEAGEIEWRLDDLANATTHEDYDPDDYEEGASDPEYIEDVRYAIEVDRKSLARQLEWLRERDRKEYEDTQAAMASGRLGGAYGRDIYRELWQNDSDYSDWKQESRLIGGETDVFAFKTEANRLLDQLGYDAITHIDSYNPGTRGVAHKVMIVFHANQVRSAFAAFDPEKAESARISD